MRLTRESSPGLRMKRNCFTNCLSSVSSKMPSFCKSEEYENAPGKRVEMSSKNFRCKKTLEQKNKSVCVQTEDADYESRTNKSVLEEDLSESIVNNNINVESDNGNEVIIVDVKCEHTCDPIHKVSLSFECR